MDDLFSLLSDDEPSAQAKAQSMIAALRGQQALGQLGQLTGDKVLGGFGGSLADSAQHQTDQLTKVGEARLSKAMEARKLAVAQANEEAQRRLQEKQIDQTGRYQQGELANRNAALEMGHYVFEPGGTGRRMDTRTGEVFGDIGGGRPLHPQDAAKLDAIISGVTAIDHIKAAKKSGLLPGFGEYDATLKAEAPALAAADSGTGRASGQNDILKRAPNLFSAAGDTMYDADRQRYIETYKARLAALKQSGYNVAEQEARLAGLGGGASAAHPQDSAAVEWAKTHPQDPRAAKILEMNK